jgi:heme A synthase
MLNSLLQAHSAVRYLILIAGIAAIAYPLFAVVTKRPYDRAMRSVCASFTGLLHLQVLLGFVAVVSGLFSPQLIGHIFMMLAAAATAQVPLSVMRRREPEERTAMPHLVANAVALALIWGGLAAIERGILDHTYF